MQAPSAGGVVGQLGLALQPSCFELASRPSDASDFGGDGPDGQGRPQDDPDCGDCAQGEPQARRGRDRTAGASDRGEPGRECEQSGAERPRHVQDGLRQHSPNRAGREAGPVAADNAGPGAGGSVGHSGAASPQESTPSRRGRRCGLRLLSLAQDRWQLRLRPAQLATELGLAIVVSPHFVTVARGYVCAFARSIETLSADLQAIRPTLLFSVPRVYENVYRRIRNRVESGSAISQHLVRWAVAVGKQYNEGARKGESCGPWLRLRHRLADALVLSKVRQGMGGRLRLAISGGAPLSEPIANFFQALGVWIVEGYGLTETSTVTHVNRLNHYRVGTVGLPLDGVECRIADDGEILIRGDNVMKGYFKDPAATREAVGDDGWFHTGDVGQIEDGGFLRITDRKKDLIVTSGGKNIAPQMIENHLREEPLISQTMVWGDKSNHLVALITLDSNEVRRWAEKEGVRWEGLEGAATDSRLVAHIRQRIRERNKELAPYEAVRDFRILPADFSTDTGELTPSMKLKRQIVMERYADLLNEMLKQR